MAFLTLTFGEDLRCYGTSLTPDERQVKMAFKKGDFYRCPDESCACEVTVTKGAPPDCAGDQSPTCCCGHTMEKVSS